MWSENPNVRINSVNKFTVKQPKAKITVKARAEVESNTLDVVGRAGLILQLNPEGFIQPYIEGGLKNNTEPYYRAGATFNLLTK